MVFSSNIFLFCFLPVFIIIYWLTPIRARNIVLLGTNLLFYTLGAGTYVLILIVSIISNYFFALLIRRSHSYRRELWLVFSIIFNLAFLFYYKYAFFLVQNIAAAAPWFGAKLHLTIPAVNLPLGISFFTFQAISYVADVYLEQIEPATSLIGFGTYHSLFPQLLAGPIVRYSEVAAQIARRRLSWDNVAEGAYRFTIGLGKKLLIANPIGSVSDAIFALPQGELSLPIAWLGTFSYAMQVYYDFAGYSDMAIGMGRALGFTFPENFNQPFRAQSITEFWRRWHMTLFRWFRDYLFIPLGGARPGAWSYVALFLVFVLCGLWHGAAATYIVWGAYQGVLMAAERYVAIRYGRVQRGLWAMLLTFGLTLLGFAVIRSVNMPAAWYHLSVMFGINHPDFVLYSIWAYLEPDKLFVFAVAIFFAWLPVERLQAPRSLGRAVPALKYAASFLVLTLSTVSLSASSFNPFIYFKF